MKKIGVVLLIVFLPAWTLGANTIVSLNTNHGSILIELYDDLAPITVANFLSYVNGGFYDGMVFHRTIIDFMIQGGAYDADLHEADFFDPCFNPGDLDFYHAPNEPIVLEVDGNLSNLRGTIAMARTSDPNSATSQFFINAADNVLLDPSESAAGYAVFGQVVGSMFPVDAIVHTKTRYAHPYFTDLPIMPAIIESARVERCTVYPLGDLNQDCYTDLADLHVLVQGWLGCTDLYDEQCS